MRACNGWDRCRQPRDGRQTLGGEVPTLAMSDRHSASLGLLCKLRDLLAVRAARIPELVGSTFCRRVHVPRASADRATREEARSTLIVHVPLDLPPAHAQVRKESCTDEGLLRAELLPRARPCHVSTANKRRRLRRVCGKPCFREVRRRMRELIRQVVCMRGAMAGRRIGHLLRSLAWSCPLLRFRRCRNRSLLVAGLTMVCCSGLSRERG